MNRPYVDIKKKNQVNQLLSHLDSFLPKFKSLAGVIGITLNGGLSRGYADHLSEIDLTFYLDQKTYEDWQKNKAPIPLGIVKFHHVLYDIKIMNFDGEASAERDAEDIELWDLSYAKILFDPNGKVSDLINKKLSTKLNLSEANKFLWEAFWHFKLAGDIWIYREDLIQGHFILNESIKPLIKALFVANNEFIPHEKWLIHLSRSLSWTPENWAEKLSQVMGWDQLTVEGLIQRQAVIENIYKEIDSYIRIKYFDGFKLACHQKYVYDLLTTLVKEGCISVDKWQSIASLSMLNMEPFHRITEINKGSIIFNKKALLSIKQDELYAWHDKITRAIIKDLALS